MKGERMKIALEDARKTVNAMLKYASETVPGKPMTFAILDEAAEPVVLLRMNGASAVTTRMCQNKAYTAKGGDLSCNRRWHR